MENDNTERFSSAFRLAILLSGNHAYREDALYIVALMRDNDLVKSVNYATKAPHKMRPYAIQAVSEMLSETLGNTPEFWKGFAEWKANEGSDSVIPCFEDELQDVMELAMPIPQEKSKEEGAGDTSTRDELVEKEFELASESVQRVSLAFRSIKAMHAALVKEFGTSAVPSYSTYAAIGRKSRARNYTLAMLRRVRESVERFESLTSEGEGVEVDKVAPSGGETQTTTEEQPTQKAQNGLRVRIDSPGVTPPVVIPRGKGERIDFVTKQLAEQLGKPFTLDDIAKITLIDDTNEVYLILREIPGVRRVGRKQYQYDGPPAVSNRSFPKPVITPGE